jgi:hypothetical protein
MVGAGESAIARWMLAGALGFIATWALVRSALVQFDLGLWRPTGGDHMQNKPDSQGDPERKNEPYDGYPNHDLNHHPSQCVSD